MNRDDEMLAKRRHMVLFLIRIMGVAFIMAGFLMIAGRIAIMGGEADRMFGAMLVLIGAVDFALVPRLLARQWKGRDTL